MKLNGSSRRLLLRGTSHISTPPQTLLVRAPQGLEVPGVEALRGALRLGSPLRTRGVGFASSDRTSVRRTAQEP